MAILTKIFVLLGLTLLLTGCDLFKTDISPKPLDSSQFRADCKLDIDQFKNVLSENISPQIRCLGENLNLFIRLVDSKKRGYMSRDALVAFLKKNPKANDAQIRDALQGLKCRCGTHVSILRAIKRAQTQMA